MESKVLLDTFRTYLSLSQRIKETSREGDLGSLEDLLEERETCQKEIGLLLEETDDTSLLDETLPELMQILYTTQDIDGQSQELLEERREELRESMGTLKKGQSMALQYRQGREYYPGASFFDRRS